MHGFILSATGYDIMKDSFGDRMKSYESVEAKRRLRLDVPVVARIDGRSFSKFTRVFERPYDHTLHSAMVAATSALVDGTHADIGFTQSDEITLVWQKCNIFDARVAKLTSVLASMATIHFALNLYGFRSSEVIRGMPHFDCRVWNVPSETEATNAVLWRSQDARKNGVSSAARSVMSAKSMHGLDQKGMIDAMLERGVCYTSFPKEHRFGTFLQRQSAHVEMSDSEWKSIPEKHRPESRTVTRSSVRTLDIEYFGDVVNRNAVVFEKHEPEFGK